ncbi:transcription-repair coupling factor [Buchnera aphidicola]|uniref:transcription-repair coupling factor n=1 Tax=Buchnera aphidicola TaxID=9 RepID=UPI003464ADCB
MITNTIFSFNINTLVIHLKHGIGKYQGLTILKNNNIETEYLTILYANDAKLYVPIYHIYLIKNYNSICENEKVVLHTLGSGKWNQERKKIFKNITDIAAKILDSNAYRFSKPGFSFKINIEKYKIFCKNFPHKMTIDQKKVIKAVLKDMNKPIPMDRLICGDVGFGKTEIAIRAAFIAVNNNKQVIVLVPTTLLAQQHYKSFQERFATWKININVLSRFQNKTEQLQCIENVKNGYTNILIGTHKILLNNLIWHNLGLLIIDEEHRFGVKQKENIKNNFSNIDILTLTATPIPRTLNMVMSNIRDLSIISTPPKNRLPVKTFIKKYNIHLIKKIILLELSRKGQIYYICNKVSMLEEKLYTLQKMIPEARFNIGHGQMNSDELKKIMYDFYQKKFDILVCTTIIETGIDIPTVNTIIIENADSFGLAQLHQMRGRVGRSYIQAYAWLLISNFKKISLNGKKRLQAIKSIKDFGAGLKLSMHDLKIRGIGELLGYNQSGHIKSIELSLYIELLNKTIQLIKKKSILSLTEIEKKQPEIQLSIPNILPNKYIPDITQRVYFYKKLYLLNNKEDLLKIQLQLINNFGILPQEVKNLILLIRIKILSNKIGITKIKSNKYGGKITFLHIPKTVDIQKLFKLCTEEFTKWNIEKKYSIKYFYKVFDDIKRIKWIFNVLKKIKNIFTVDKLSNS